FQVASVAAFGGGAVLNSIKSVLTFGLLGDPGDSFGQMLSAAASAAATGAQIAQTMASYERREREWYLQRGIAGKDVEIGNQQVLLAAGQRELARQESELAVQQR